MIRKIVQGDDHKQDRDLFCFIGPLATSREMTEKLGMPIYSESGDIWHLYLGPSGTLWGFALTHVFKTTKSAHIRFLHVPDGNVRVQADLLAAVLMLVRDNELKCIYTYDRKDAIVWQKAGFSKHKKARSSFFKWEKSFKETK
jgi:hypothetical protein